jgi:hypothetical protein
MKTKISTRAAKNRQTRLAFFTGCVAAAGLAFSAAPGLAATISSGNSTVTLNPTNDLLPYISSWVVDGTDQLGGTPAGSENFLEVIGVSGPDVYFNSLPVTGSSIGGNTAMVTYTTTGLIVTSTTTITGGSAGSGSSDLKESVTLRNTGASAIALDFASLINLNLDSLPLTDTLTFGGQTLQQTNSKGTEVKVTLNTTPALISVSTAGDAGSFFDVAPPGPFTGDIAFHVHLGTIDGTTDIAAGSTASFSVDETLTGGLTTSSGAAVPLPNAAANISISLAGLAAIALVRRMRRTGAVD